MLKTKQNMKNTSKFKYLIKDIPIKIKIVQYKDKLGFKKSLKYKTKYFEFKYIINI